MFWSSVTFATGEAKTDVIELELSSAIGRI